MKPKKSRTPQKPAALLDWQQRVVDEKAELEEKIRKLNAFLWNQKFFQLDSKNQALLICQQIHMGNYYNVLAERISLFRK